MWFAGKVSVPINAFEAGLVECLQIPCQRDREMTGFDTGALNAAIRQQVVVMPGQIERILGLSPAAGDLDWFAIHRVGVDILDLRFVVLWQVLQ